MNVIKVGTYIGAVVEDFKLNAADHDQRDLVRELLLEHKVLFFKHQHLEPAEFIAVARNLGTPETHPFVYVDDPVAHGTSHFHPYAEYPEIIGIYHDEKHTGNLNSWHSDLNWRQVPTFASILRGVRIPPVGGDTCWANMGAAYTYLPESVQRELDGLRIVHDWLPIYQRQRAFEGNEALLEQMRVKYPVQSHPLVLRHPFTGEKVLFSNKVSGTRIEGLSEQESRRLLDMVHLTAWRPEVQCRFHWDKGDIAMWDNLATQHYAVSDYAPHIRIVERITLEGVPLE